MLDREWPALDTEWCQADLRAYVMQMGINPDPSEFIPQGVKWIEWPQPPLTEAEIERGREIVAQLESENSSRS